MPRNYAILAGQAADLTNKQLASAITELSRVTTEDLAGLLPTKRDKQTFVELMKIVQAETSEDEAAAKLAGDIGRLGKVVVKALKLLV